MPKEDCKYWDKCYQKNEHHLEKYNHPEKTVDNAVRKPNDSPGKAPKQQTTKIAQDELPHGSNKKEGDSSESVADKRKQIDTNALREEVLGNMAGKNYMEILQKRIRLSVQMEYDELLRSNEFIRHKFLVQMPTEFYTFWKFACELRPKDTGSQVLSYMEKTFQLLLVGPFEFLAEQFHNATLREPGDYLRHWRFYFDPPEFQTVFVKKDTGIHYGYWRDVPQDKERLMLARNDASKNCEFEFIAGNTFDALIYYLEKDFASTPFSTATVATTKKMLHKYLETNELKLEKLQILRKERDAKVVAKAFHRAGIVVPFIRKTQAGYRPLIVSDAELKQILKLFDTAGKKEENAVDDTVKTAVIEKLQPIATAASIAVDECDFGTSLELGIDLFCSGRTELHGVVQSLLVPAYTLLERPQYIAISKAHLEKRMKGHKLSIFDLDNK